MRRDPQRRWLLALTICSTKIARAICRYSIPDAAPPPHARLCAGAQATPDPHHPLYAALAFLTAHHLRLPAYHDPFQQCTNRPQRSTHALPVLPRTTFTTTCVRSAGSSWPVPPLSVHRAPSASPAITTLPVYAPASAHLQHDTDHPRRAHHLRQPFPIARTASITSLRAATVSNALTTLRSKPASSGTAGTTRSTDRSTQQVQRALPVPVSLSSPPRAPRPSRASARNVGRVLGGYHLRCAQHTLLSPSPARACPSSAPYYAAGR